MRRNFWNGLVLLLILIGLDTYVSLPYLPTFLKWPIELRQGLDLQGGVRLVYELDLSNTANTDRTQAIESTRNVIERRVNTTGVTEPLIQPSKVGNNYSMIVELPGIRDVNKAVELIGKTAQLEFKEQDSASADTNEPKWLPTGLTGKQLKKALVSFEPTTNAPQITLQFNQ